MYPNLEAMMDLEDYSHFRADLVALSPESFTPGDLREILDDMIRSKAAMEDGLHEHFATLTEAEQTMLLDNLGANGYRDRGWWYRMLMDFPVHRDRPTV